jgi:tetratricopeptide (TPR) repeat protein
MAPIAAVVQCFVKADTLQGLLESLLRCAGRDDTSLIIWQDSTCGSRREAEFVPAAEGVHAYVVDFVREHGRSFHSVDYRLNDRNLGPYSTCKAALDFAFERHDFAVLLEDDIILSSDALRWFNQVRDLGLLTNQNAWAVAGQSIFFDARKKEVTPAFVQRAAEIARQQDLVSKFTIHDFVPSACFATTRRWWTEFGATRGEPRGDVLLCQRTKEEGRGCVFPIVPRAKDVGMLHDYGFSVTIHTKEGVDAITNTYLLAADLLPERPLEDLERFDGDLGVLFRQTTLLEGFSSDKSAREEAATAASERGDWERAAALWDELRKMFPQNASYWLKAGEALSEARMIDRAEHIFDEAIFLFPDHNWIAYRHIRVAHDSGRCAEALERAEKLRRKANDFWPAWVAATDALVMLGRMQEAEELARQAVATFPNEFWPNYWLSRLQAEHRDSPGSIQIWEELVSRFPRQAPAVDGFEAAKRKAAQQAG